MEKGYVVLQGIASAVLAWISAKLGILLPVLVMFMFAMVLDYISGMAASKYEALEHPGDTAYGWNSKKGLKGIIKKVGYMMVIGAAMIFDYIISCAAGQIGIEVKINAMFGLLVTVWYILNELLSIIENVGRMGKPVPDWLSRYIAVLKNNIDEKGKEQEK